MAKAQAQEPSMEEILASIRRIIADEDKTPPEAAAPEAESHVSEDDLDKLFGSGAGSDEDDAPDVAVEVEEDVLELTEDAIDEVADVDFGPEEPVPAPPPVAKPAAAAPRPAPVAAVVTAEVPSAPLLSAATGQAVAAAFGSLGALGAQPGLGAMPTHSGGQTIEDMMRDMLRPMLQSWLDANLPGVVERLVRAEIERAARGGR